MWRIISLSRSDVDKPDHRHRRLLRARDSQGRESCCRAADNPSAILQQLRLSFYGDHSPLTARPTFAAYLRPLRKIEWVVHAKRPFGGPEAVLAYLSRYTQRVAIANRRLISADANSVNFRYKDYRREGPDHYKVMTLATGEFIRRFQMHVLPKGFHRIRHYGPFGKAAGVDNIARARQLLAGSQDEIVGADVTTGKEPPMNRCPCCGGRMIIIETFQRGATPRHRPTAPTASIRIDSS